MCKRRQAKGMNWLFWDLGSCGAMVDSENCYDLGHKITVDLRPVQHRSCFHPCKSPSHWINLCPSTKRFPPQKGRWSPSPKVNSLWSKTVSLVFLPIRYRTSHQARSNGIQTWSMPIHQQATHHHHICWWHFSIWKEWWWNQWINRATKARQYRSPSWRYGRRVSWCWYPTRWK